jgi:hypothetical protein
MSGDPEDEFDHTRVMPGRLADEGQARQEGDLDDVATHMVGKRVNNPVARLLVIEGPGIGNGRPIYPGTNSVGRDIRNRIPLDYGDDSISRIGHAVIVVGRDASDMRIIDGGKVNAIHLNSVMVTGEQPLAIGDIIEIGLTLLRVEAL